MSFEKFELCLNLTNTHVKSLVTYWKFLFHLNNYWHQHQPRGPLGTGGRKPFFKDILSNSLRSEVLSVV